MKPVQEVIRFYSTREGYQEFSNFYYAPFTHKGKRYTTVEHFFQAMKFPDDPNWQKNIREAKGAAMAKKYGQSRLHPMRADWEQVKDGIMLIGCTAKFNQHPDLAELLLSTGDARLIEASPTDAYWGEGRHQTGRNQLGITLMQVRDTLRRKKK